MVLCFPLFINRILVEQVCVMSHNMYYMDSDLSVKRKIEKHREKVLHSDSLLQRNPFVQTIPSSKQKKSKKKNKEIQTAKAAAQDCEKVSLVCCGDQIKEYG